MAEARTMSAGSGVVSDIASPLRVGERTSANKEWGRLELRPKPDRRQQPDRRFTRYGGRRPVDRWRENEVLGADNFRPAPYQLPARLSVADTPLLRAESPTLSSDG
jgi:hypothetical protein